MQYLQVFISPISIRAPARGGTVNVNADLNDYGISIRAPARGATRVRLTITILNTISIRAPARGATRDP